MSLDDIRNQILSNSNEEERVEVNQRILIENILARYSTEFVVYRELMQNSDDAKSSKIEILFETENDEKIKRIQYKNNGFAFRPEDWDRVRKIAEGNPDEQKIGAFGVGFYSLFSICEKPFISSGGQGMAFVWHGNQLFTKSGQFADSDNVWTTFLMDMRDPIDLPNVEKFAQFLANSLGFTENLREVSVCFNGDRVIQLSKNVQKLKSMDITSEFDTSSPLDMFHLASVDIRHVELDAKYQTEEAEERKEESMFFRIVSGNLDVRVREEFSAKMKRITKKNPPRKTTIQIIFTGFDENSSPGDYISPIFKDLRPYPEQGRIYIGFSTHQTTGCCSHLAARVIPTIERESIDLVEETLARYNTELLSLAGTLCRILYEDEMIQVARLNNDDDRQKRAVHALTHFTFNQSTPSAKVGSIMESQFFRCSGQELYILSTEGVLPISDVRMPNSEMSGFIKQIPIVPEILLEECSTFFEKACEMKLIGNLTLQDVLGELKSRILSEEEMSKLLKWWISYRPKRNRFEFMKYARVGDQSLNTIRYFLNHGTIPVEVKDLAVPADVLSYNISRNFKKQELIKWFEWSELSLFNWAKFIVSNPDLETDSAFAERVHLILSRGLKHISENDKIGIHQLFAKKACIPTNLGMKIPDGTYFQNVDLFPDLPTIQFQKPLSGQVQTLMELLGVRKVVELKLIFDRLDGQGSWDQTKLIKYLASKQNDLKGDEEKKLKHDLIWYKENSQQMQRFTLYNLYTPCRLNREFDLPIIDWKGTREPSEVKFLTRLGLREYPRLEKILELAAPPTDPKIRSRALDYFIDSFEKKYSMDYDSKVDVEFLPCSDSDIYAKPSECYINPECKIMKFKVIRQDLRYRVERLGVCQHPSRDRLINKLIQDPPRDENNAKKIFEYLTSQLYLTRSDLDKLTNSKFIPARSKTNGVILVNPRDCFLKSQGEILDDFFWYVDFGEKANRFLQSCGVKDEPSSIDFAELLVESSHKLWNSIDSEKYLYILRTIAIGFSLLRSRSGLITKMKQKPILVAVKKQPSNSETVDNINDEDSDILSYYLNSAKQIFINDNKIYQRIFDPLTAPEEDCLEELYKKLGCKSLSDSVKETSNPKGTSRMTKKSQELQDLIIERTSLFYHKRPKNEIKRDEEWLKKIEVREVDYIETIYKLGTTKKTKKNATSILQDKVTNSWTLYITSKSNNLEISKHIVMNIYQKDKDIWNNTHCLNSILITPLQSLKEMGYPVDRILKQSNLQHTINQMKADQNDNNTLNLMEYPVDRKIQPPNLQHINKKNISREVGDNNLSSIVNNLPSIVNSSPSIVNSSPSIVNNLPSVVLPSVVNSSPSIVNNLVVNNSPTVFIPKLNVYNSQSYISTPSTGIVVSTIVTSENTRILRDFLRDSIRVFYSNSANVTNNQNSIVKFCDLDGVMNHQSNIKIVNESRMSYCDIISDDLLFCDETLQEIEFYIPEGLSRSEILTQVNVHSLNQFINMLKDLADVFELLPKDIHVFYKDTYSIAFNRNNALFFNFKFYLELHDEECKVKPTINALTYWFMMFCHELAHNFMPYHNSEHEYYLQLFAEVYMSNLSEIMKKYEIL